MNEINEINSDALSIITEVNARQDGLVKSPLVRVSEILKRAGIYIDHINTALLTFITLNSARFHDPIVLILTEDPGAGAERLLSLCVELTPELSVMEFLSLSKDFLFRIGSGLKGKALVGYDTEAFKKALREVFHIRDRGVLTNNRLDTKKRPETVTAEGPISCVMICSNLRDPILKNPNLLRTHLESSRELRLHLMKRDTEISSYSESQSEIEFAVVRKLLECTVPAQVEIPYIDRLIEALVDLDPILAPTVFKIIRNVTRINNHTPLDQRRLIEDGLGIRSGSLDKYDIRNQELLSDSTTSSEPQTDRINAAGILIATKVDYFYSLPIIEGIVGGEGSQVTERQRRIFNAIKAVNCSNRWLDHSTPAQVLGAINSNPSVGWPDIHQILHMINKDGEVRQGTLNDDLQKLVEGNIIIKQKDPNSRNKMVYAINIYSVDSPMRLPHPSEIMDPVYNGALVTVINPMTGLEVTI